MGLMKHLVSSAIDACARSLMGATDSATGGLASKLSNIQISGADSHAMSNIANKAIDYLPSGNVKTALSKINDAAQG